MQNTSSTHLHKRSLPVSVNFDAAAKRPALGKSMEPKEVDQKVKNAVEDLMKHLERHLPSDSKNPAVRKLVINHISQRVRQFITDKMDYPRDMIERLFDYLVSNYRSNLVTLAKSVKLEHQDDQISIHCTTLLDRYKERPLLREIQRFKEDNLLAMSRELFRVFKNPNQLHDWLTDESDTEKCTAELLIESTLKPYCESLENRLRPYLTVKNQEGKVLPFAPFAKLSNIILNMIKDEFLNDTLPSDERQMRDEWIPEKVINAFVVLNKKVLKEYAREDHEQAIHKSEGHCFGVTLSTALNYPSPTTSAFFQEFYVLKRKIEKYYDAENHLLGQKILQDANDIFTGITRSLTVVDNEQVVMNGPMAVLFLKSINIMHLLGRQAIAIDYQETNSLITGNTAKQLSSLVSNHSTLAKTLRLAKQCIILGEEILTHRDRFPEFLAGWDSQPEAYPASAYVLAADILRDLLQQGFSFLNFLEIMKELKPENLSRQQAEKLARAFGLTDSKQLFEAGTLREIQRIGLKYYDIGHKARKVVKTKPQAPSKEYCRLDVFDRECSERQSMKSLFANFGLQSRIVFAGEPLKDLHNQLQQVYKQFFGKSNAKLQLELILGDHQSRHSMYMSFFPFTFRDPNLKDEKDGQPILKTFNTIEDLIEHIAFYIAANYEKYTNVSLNHLEFRQDPEFGWEKNLEKLIAQRKDLNKRIDSIKERIMAHSYFYKEFFDWNVMLYWPEKIQTLFDSMNDHMHQLEELDRELSPYLAWKIAQLRSKRSDILLDKTISKETAAVRLISVIKIIKTYEELQLSQ